MTVINNDGRQRYPGYVISPNKKREPEEPSEKRKEQGRRRKEIEELLSDKQLAKDIGEVWDE